MPRHTTAPCHLDGLIQYLEERYGKPDLACFEPDELFGDEPEALAAARTQHAGLRGETAERDDG